MPEDRGVARGEAQQVEEDSDRGRLAGAVHPEESKELTTPSLQIKTIYRDELAVALGQSTNRDRSGAGEHKRILTTPQILAAWRHNVRGGRTCVHDPDATLLRVVR